MDKSTRFFFVTLPALMLIVVLIAAAALWNRASNPPNESGGPSSPVAIDSEEKIIFAPGQGTLSGVVLTPDGQPNSTPATLHYRTERWNSENHHSGASGTLATNVTDSFSCEIPAGITTIVAEAEGYAISSIGPFKNYAGQTIDEIEFRLDAGQPLTLTVRGPDGKPVTDARLSGSSQFADSYRGDQKPENRGAGTYEFLHVAAVPYRIRCSAPGFEPTEMEIDSPHNKSAMLTLRHAQPTTGVVLDSGGQPVPNAKLILLYRHPNHYFSGGKELGQADEHGKFRLMTLSRKHQYSGIVEAAGGRLGTFENLKPGQTEMTLHIASPSQLTGTVYGNLDELSRRDGKHSVRINQRVPFGLLNGSEKIPFNSHAPVETGDDEQTFTFNGLLTNDWELSAGDVKYQHDGRQGDVHLDINLETGEVTATITPFKMDHSEPRSRIPGRLLKPDGSPFEGEAKLLYVLTREKRHKVRSSIGGLGTVQSAFTVPAMPHITQLVVEADGYALTVVQPFARQSGQNQEELEIVLESGEPLEVQVRDLNGEPIFDAKLELRAFFHSRQSISRRGRKHAVRREAGAYVFPHVADRPHEVNISAPGFEDRTITFYHRPSEPLKISMELESSSPAGWVTTQQEQE